VRIEDTAAEMVSYRVSSVSAQWCNCRPAWLATLQLSVAALDQHTTAEMGRLKNENAGLENAGPENAGQNVFYFLPLSYVYCRGF